MRPVIPAAASLLGALALAAPPAAADIVQDAGVFDTAITFHNEIGQVFTAVDAQISRIAFAFSDINPTFPNDPVTMHLYAGEGFGGTLIHSVAQLLPDVLPGTSDQPQFIDFDFSGISLAVGQTYTVSVTTSNSPKVAVVFSGADPYADGYMISAVEGAHTFSDLNFRVTAVPAPGCAALLSLGALAAAGRRRAR